MKKSILWIGTLLVIGFLSYVLLRQENGRAFIFSLWEESKNSATPNERLSRPDGPQAPSTARRDEEKDFFVEKAVSFNLIKQQAENGDPIAQRRLSEMYEDCAIYSIGPERYFKTLDELSSRNPGSQPYIEKIKEQTKAFCRRVDGGQPIPIEAYALWQEQSAKAGDLIASIRQSSRSLEVVEQKQMGDFIEKVRSSKDPQALYELSNLVDGYQGELKDEEEQRLFGKDYSNHAMAIAACRAGMNCSSTSRLMRQVCTSLFRCKYANYEEFVYSELVTPAQRREVEGLVSRINEYFHR